MRFIQAVLLLFLLSQILTAQYCQSLISPVTCAGTKGCAYRNINQDFLVIQCTQFAGCTAYIGSSEAICKSINIQCTSDGQFCTNLADCSSYILQSTCIISSSINGVCIWSSTCREASCSDAPNALTTNLQCNSFLLGCLTNGQGCSSILNTCANYQGTIITCAQYVGSDGNCMGQLTAISVASACLKYSALCQYESTGCISDLCCQLYLPGCITIGYGCATILSPCASYSNFVNQNNVSIQCSQFKGSEGNCTGIGTCVAKTCSDVETSGFNTDAACAVYLPGCLQAAGTGCVAAPACTTIVNGSQCALVPGCVQQMSCQDHYACTNQKTDIKCWESFIGCYWDTICKTITQCSQFQSTDTYCSTQSSICVHDSTTSACLTKTLCTSYRGIQAICLAVRVDGQDIGCTGTSSQTTDTQCFALDCTANITATSQSQCQAFGSVCYYLGTLGCNIKPTSCEVLFGTSSQCASYSIQSGQQTIKCTNTSITIPSQCQLENKCATKNNTSSSACQNVDPTCYYDQTTFFCKQFSKCSDALGDASTCSTLISVDGPCSGTAYINSYPEQCQVKKCAQVDYALLTNSVCQSYLSTCVSRGYGCTSSPATCAVMNSYASCSAQSECVSKFSQCISSCTSFNFMGQCFYTIAYLGGTCVWDYHGAAYNQGRKCFNPPANCESYTYSTNSEALCVSKSSLCTTSGSLCITRNFCTTYTSSIICTSATALNSVNPALQFVKCKWNSTSCQQLLCSDAPTTATSNTNCTTFLSGCITNGAGCMSTTYSCSNWLVSTLCTQDSLGNNCFWISETCYKYTTCTDLTFTTASQCQVPSSLCLSDGTKCIPKNLCSNYQNSQSCVIGIDGVCLWYSTNCYLKTACALFTTQQTCITGTDGSCVWQNSTAICFLKRPCFLYGTVQTCITGTDGSCFWYNNACVLSTFCSDYSVQSVCITGGDGTCLWWNNQCFLQRACSQYIWKSNCFTGIDGPCVWKNNICFLLQTCSQYNSSLTCITGTDGSCIWADTLCILFQACSNYNNLQTCINGRDGSCIWLNTFCIVKQACQNYTEFVNCIQGTDGLCVWLATRNTCKLSYCLNSKDSPATCQCKAGYFEQCTKKCDPQCGSCNTARDTCLICNLGYVNPPVCEIECSKAKPSAYFSNDLLQIIIDFHLQIRSTITCSGLFNSQTLSALGTNCQCIGNNGNTISVTLGQTATILPNTSLGFQNNYIYLANCTAPLAEIIRPVLALPAILLKPSVTFDSNMYLTTTCDDVIITIIQQQNNGQRVLQLEKWLVNSADNTTLLYPLVQEWNQNISQSYFILSQKFLSGQTRIELSLIFSNFVGAQSSQSILIIVQSQCINYIMKPQKQIPFSKYIVVLLTIQVQSCQSSAANEFNISISLQNETSSINQSLTFIAGVSQILQLPLSQLSFQPYQLKLYDSLSQKLTIPLWLVPFDTLVSISGGDQQIGINQIMNLTGYIINRNIQTAINVAGYQIRWLCMDLSTNSTCFDTSSYLLQFQLNTFNISGLHSLQITLKVQGINDREYQRATIIVSVIDDIINQMFITGNECALNSVVNLNDKLNLSIHFTNTSINKSSLKGKLSYLKGSTYEPFIEFNYSSFLVDINLLYTISKMDSVKLQVTVTLPEFDQPSTSTLNLTINIPPQKCKLRLTPRLDQYNLEIFGCLPISYPLQYQFIYYNNQSDYDQDSNIGVIQNGVIMIDLQVQSAFITYLSGSNTSLIAALIQDSFGGQSNTSVSLTGLQFINASSYGTMLKDKSQNLQRNIFMILNDNQLNQRRANEQESQLINKTLLGANQTQSLVMQNLILYQSLYGVSVLQLQSQFNTITNFAMNLSSQVDLLQISQASGDINPIYQAEIRDIYQKANDVGNYISSLYIQAQTAQDNQTSGVDISSILLEGTSNLTSILSALCSVNQGPLNITTESFTLTTQKFSGKEANSYFKSDVIENQTQVFNYLIQIVLYTTQVFKVNPYKVNLTNGLNAPLIIPSLSDVLSNKKIIPANPIPITFPLIGDITVSCTSLIKGSWSLDVCKVIQSTIIECLCETLSPLSIVEAAKLIADTFGALFQTSIIQKITNFPYYQAIFTYIIGSFVIIYFVGKFFLHKIDLYNSTQVIPAKDAPICISIDDMNRGDKSSQNDTARFPKKLMFDSMKIIKHKIVIDSIVDYKVNKIDDHCLIGQVNNQSISKFKGFVQFLKHSHVLFSLYWLYDPEEPRILRITILFLGLFGKICIFVLFGKNLAMSILLVLSICQTVYGIFFGLILSKMLKSKNTRINGLGIILAMILTLFQAYLMIAALALYSTSSLANSAALSYLASLGADYFVSNIIIELLKYIFALKAINFRGAQIIFSKLFSATLHEVVFGKSLANQSISHQYISRQSIISPKI